MGKNRIRVLQFLSFFHQVSSMENPNPSISTCVLRVNAKCCNACRNNAKRKLQSVSGVREVECNEEGLIRVEGEVNPMRLLRKVQEWGENHKWGRDAEIVSVAFSHQRSHVPENPPPQRSRCFLLRCCFGIHPRKPKVQPFTSSSQNWQSPQSGRASPFTSALPPAVYPPPQAMNWPYPPPCSQLHCSRF